MFGYRVIYTKQIYNANNTPIVWYWQPLSWATTWLQTHSSAHFLAHRPVHPIYHLYDTVEIINVSQHLHTDNTGVWIIGKHYNVLKVLRRSPQNHLLHNFLVILQNHWCDCPFYLHLHHHPRTAILDVIAIYSSELQYFQVSIRCSMSTRIPMSLSFVHLLFSHHL